MKKAPFLIFLTALILLISTKENVSAAQEKDSSATQQRFSLSFEGKTGAFKPAQSSYLGTQIGADPAIFDFVETDDNLDLKAAGTRLSYQLHNTPFFKHFTGLKITGGVETGLADQTVRFDTLDPMGNNLIIPGVGVGPDGVGFSLIGPTNQITDARYNTEFDYHKFILEIETELKTENPAFKIAPSFGIEYAKAVTTNSFAGDIPFFLRQFSYNTKTDIETISPTIGLTLSYKLNPIFDVFGSAQYAYNFNRGNGRDSLFFTGRGTQTAIIDNNKSTDSYGLTIGMDINLDAPFILTLQGNYQNLGNVPVINTRDGNGVSDFSYEDSDIYNATIRTTFKF